MSVGKQEVQAFSRDVELVSFLKLESVEMPTCFGNVLVSSTSSVTRKCLNCLHVPFTCVMLLDILKNVGILKMTKRS